MQPKHFLILFIGIICVSAAGYLFTKQQEIPATEITLQIPAAKAESTNITDTKDKTAKAVQASPFDYSKVKNTKEKKRIFFDTLRPVIAKQNKIIKSRRQEILLAKKNNEVHEGITALADKYDVKWDSKKPDWKTLLYRVDTLPQELVMAQAANESAWGTSRFAQTANNLFGQWCFKKGCGLIPEKRDTGANHEVRKFSSIDASIASYMHNINTNRAYRELRKLRAKLRASNGKVDGHTLANGLSRYSTRGKAYVKEIQSMIKTNKRLMKGKVKT